MENDIGYESKTALPNKLLQDDGTITDITGKKVESSIDAYNNKPALPNKFLNPDGTYSTLNEILAEMIDTELFIIVDELPATGESNKIYMLVDGNKLIEYVWVNGKWDPVGMVEFDINNYYTKAEVTQLIATALQTAKDYADSKDNEVKSYVDSNYGTLKNIKVYDWKENPSESVAFFQQVLDDYLSGKIVVVICTKRIDINVSYGSLVFVFDESLQMIMPTPSTRSYVLISPVLQIDKTTHHVSTSSVVATYYKLELKLDSSDYTVITEVNYNFYGVSTSEYLDTNQNYSTPYTPLYNGSPATKKYVDDSIANSITSALGGEY